MKKQNGDFKNKLDVIMDFPYVVRYSLQISITILYTHTIITDLFHF
jgi:hypothetical protein